MTDKKLILYLAIILSIFTYNFWIYLPKHSFYIGNSIVVALLSIYLFKEDKKSFIKFFIFELSIANLMKEIIIFLNYHKLIEVNGIEPGKLSLEEASLLVIVPFIWYLKVSYDKSFSRTLEGN